ncbi:hypothetical protein COV58_00540 [Candidatus Roizmanbacteria bacterium CG11_big_fil_rev_8_21_14_0_20_36_8]|uniref:Band 7 domain-containing protein n=2 Tax=Candidatus Roizmaniibacteriota TaxID=1752723 RepID=A0A2M6IUZ9_9BACT|nr:MAG: hypothetical protein COV58_00540 [Candidatus Roizmanbacteria bacterium CG11_big_fil_rev_8_21_14_0_20_36_8]PIZ63222.1 MAG: hypothetical protein COY16_02490 [Candidatus Roizmanbacteria bacterium CG_4_10_14_0_2_um_filter_39_13]
MITFLKVASFLIVCATISVTIWLFYEAKREVKAYDDERFPVKRWMYLTSLAIFFLGTILSIILTGATQVPATRIAVVENTWTGRFYTLGPGTHFWPVARNLTPLVSRVFQYDLRRQVIEIGESPVQENGVQADSNSPGRPVVFFHARGWANPNPETIIELHKRYGEGYLDNWVERVWVSALKGVQGQAQYDEVGSNRVVFQDLVETTLQMQLLDENETPLVFVSQLAIVDFDFEDSINTYLNTVAEKEFSRQQAEIQIGINTAIQEAQTIDAQTNYITTKRKAEAEKEKRIAEADGAAQAVVLAADAAAYEITARYQAEAGGITAVQTALAASPDAYLEYVRNTRWDGVLPQYMLGGAPVPFISLPNTSPTPSATETGQ